MYSKPFSFGDDSGGTMRSYYYNQAGSGVGGFAGARFQRGHGWGSFFMPLLKYLGPKILSTGANIASDAIAGQNVLESLKTRGKKLSRDVAHDAADRVERYAQTGKGKRRRRRRKTTLAKPKKNIKRVTKARRGHKRRRTVNRKRSVKHRIVKPKIPISIFS